MRLVWPAWRLATYWGPVLKHSTEKTSCFTACLQYPADAFSLRIMGMHSFASHVEVHSDVAGRRVGIGHCTFVAGADLQANSFADGRLVLLAVLGRIVQICLCFLELVSKLIRTCTCIM